MPTTDAFDYETARREKLLEVNTSAPPADAMDTDKATELFEFVGFSAPYVVVVRRSDRVKGTLTFTHNPRLYFDFQPAS